MLLDLLPLGRAQDTGCRPGRLPQDQAELEEPLLAQTSLLQSGPHLVLRFLDYALDVFWGHLCRSVDNSCLLEKAVGKCLFKRKEQDGVRTERKEALLGGRRKEGAPGELTIQNT